MAYRLVVLASGSGTLAQAIFDARVDLECEILVVITDNPAAPVLVKAQAVGIATDVLAVGASRHEWNLQMIARVGAEKPDLVVSVGFMRILPLISSIVFQQ